MKTKMVRGGATSLNRGEVTARRPRSPSRAPGPGAGWGLPILAAEFDSMQAQRHHRCQRPLSSSGTGPKTPVRAAAPPGQRASPPSTPSTPVKATLSPGVATPVIDATTLTPWLGPERAPPAPLPEIVETDELSDPAFGEWLRAAPPPPRWVASERAFLSRVRRECAVQLARAPNYPEAYGDRRLIRFLRQHKSEKKGVKAVKEYLRWREAEKIDLDSRSDHGRQGSAGDVAVRCVLQGAVCGLTLC